MQKYRVAFRFMVKGRTYEEGETIARRDLPIAHREIHQLIKGGNLTPIAEAEVEDEKPQPAAPKRRRKKQSASKPNVEGDSQPPNAGDDEGEE